MTDNLEIDEKSQLAAKIPQKQMMNKAWFSLIRTLTHPSKFGKLKNGIFLLINL